MLPIAAVLITRNEQRCITRALNSIKPFVDAMIVLDTGSQDETVALAKQAGAQVYHFDWCDDFSKARNAALDHSPAHWNFMLDADEYLISGGPALRAIAAQHPECVGAVSINSAFEQNQTLYSVHNWLIRLLPRAIRYTGRVHEQPVHHLPIQHLAIQLDHDGYLPEQHRLKRGRNENLLHRCLEDTPHDSYLHYQLGKEMEVDAHFTAAITHYQNAFQYLKDPFENWQRDLVIRALFCLKKVQAFEEAIDLAARWKEELADMPDFHFVLGDIYLDRALAQPTQANRFLPLIETHWLQCLEIGERPDLDGCVKGRGSTLAAHNLYVFYESMGLTDKAAHYKSLIHHAPST